MAVVYETFRVESRNTKGGGVRPGFSYQGIKEGSLRVDNIENFFADVLSVSNGDIKSLALRLEKALNRLAAQEANPFSSDEYKAARQVAKLMGKDLSPDQLLRLAEKIKDGSLSI